jgi:signal transduction histidine kinase
VRRWSRPTLVAASRLALVAMLLIAVLYVLAAAVLDAFVARRVVWEADQRLSDRLAVVSSLHQPLDSRTLPDEVGTDGAPVFVWYVAPGGAVTGLTEGEPRLPPAARRLVATPLSIRTGPATFRYDFLPFDNGGLVAAQNLAGPSHIDQVLVTAELLLGPVLLLAVFAGVLVIGVRSAAPVEAARRRLQELTADASHELRTPLTVIEAEIELARSGPPDPDADREALDHVARESRRLKSIVEDLLWLARFDTAPPEPVHAPADLTAVATTGLERFGPVASARGVTLGAAIDDAPVWVDAAGDWLDRLAGTLLDNACRYVPAGGRVHVTATGVSGRAVLRVEDDGPGIPPTQRAILFDRFRRATDAPGGAGLGLAIADSVVRSTGGRWRVDDSPMGGASMEVSWRLRAPGRAPETHEGPTDDGATSEAEPAPPHAGR